MSKDLLYHYPSNLIKTTVKTSKYSIIQRVDVAYWPIMVSDFQVFQIPTICVSLREDDHSSENRGSHYLGRHMWEFRKSWNFKISKSKNCYRPLWRISKKKREPPLRLTRLLKSERRVNLFSQILDLTQNTSKSDP